MKWSYLSFLPIILLLVPICQGTCLKRYDLSGVISDSRNSYSPYKTCWKIEVPQDTYVRLDFEQLSLSRTYSGCSETYVEIIVPDANDSYKYCNKDTENWKPVTALNDVIITFAHNYFYRDTFTTRIYYRTTNYPYYRTFSYYETTYNPYASSSFELNYHIEDLICVQKNNFRCSNHSCIPQSKVCDGVKDCPEGIDEIGCGKGILSVKGVDESRKNAITWLKNQRSPYFGWGKNTHRAIAALHLAQTSSFRGQNLEEELMVKQLELQASVALLRNSTDPLSVSELGMFVNALTVTCHNPRRFYGYDLLQILGERVSVQESAGSPGAYLTLCNSGWKLSQSDIRSLLKFLHKHSKYPFLLDVQAMTVMALTCAKNQTMEFTSIASKAYNATIEKFIDGQLPDGSFGNVHTTALVTQALVASGQENNKRWNVTSTMKYLMKQLNSSSIDFLSAYFALPIFSGRSLADTKTVDCSNTSRKQDEDNEISDVTNKLGGKIRVQYSLYIGDQKDVIHTIVLRMPEKSSAYDVMRVAQVADPKYKFHHRDVSGHLYVYGIADITNDPEAGKFWLLYTMDNNTNGTVTHHTQSPDELMLGNADHLIMWYKTA